MSRAKKEPSPPTSFRFGEDLRAALKVIAEREGRSMANAIDWLAKGYFKQNKLDWPTPNTEESNQSKEKSE